MICFLIHQEKRHHQVTQKKNINSPSNSDGGADASASIGRSIGKTKRDNHDLLQVNNSAILQKRMVQDLSINQSPAYRKAYIKTLHEKGYDEDQLNGFADNILPALQKHFNGAQEKQEAPLSQEQIDALASDFASSHGGGLVSGIPVIDKYVAKQTAGIEAGAKQMAKGAAKTLDYRSTLGDVITGGANEVAGVAKAGFAASGLVLPQMVAFNAATEAVHALPESVKSTFDIFGEGTPQTEKERSENFDKTIDAPFALASTIAQATGHPQKEGSFGGAMLEIADILIGAAGAHMVSSGGEPKIKNQADLLATIEKVKEGDKEAATNYNDFVGQIQNLTPENIQHEAEVQGKTEIADKIKDANIVPDDEAHTKLATLNNAINSPKIQALPDNNPIKQGLVLDRDQLAADLQKKNEDQTHADIEDAHINAQIADIDHEIANATELMKGEPDAIKESYQHTIDNLKLKRDAFSIKKSDEVDVRQQAGNGEGVGAENIQSENTSNESKTETGLQKENKKVASIMFAPYYDFTVSGAEDAAKVKDSPSYKKYKSDIGVIADQLGIKVTGIDDTIGGFENADGNKIVEVSTKVNLEVDSFEQAEELAAMMGSLSPETQEASIAAQHVDEGDPNHNADTITFPVDDVDKTIEALKEAGIDNYSINESDKTVSFVNVFDQPDLEIDNKLINLANKLNEKGVNYGKQTRKPTRSSYIDSEKNHAILRGMEESLRGVSDSGREPHGGMLRDAVQEAIRKRERFNAERGVAEERKSYAALRDKQLKLQAKGEDLSPEELTKMKELDKVLRPVLEASVKSEERNYENAKSEIEEVATKAVGDKGFNLPFGIKKAERAATKILDWYQGNPRSLGDGARTNIIVDNIADADKVFEDVKKEYPGSITREENETTEYGYPKRLLEVRTENGRVAEFQVMEPLAYIAKDGVKDFTKEKQDFAKEQLATLQKKIGEKIPDGAGHWFYEIGRDNKVPKEIQDAAKDVSKTYYEAFTKPDEYLKGPKDLEQKIKSFNDLVENADRSKWAKDHLVHRPISVLDYLYDNHETGISREMRAKQRKELGLTIDEEKIRSDISDHTWNALNKEANRLIDSGEVDPLQYAQDIIDGKIPSTDLSQTILLRGAVEVGDRVAEADAAFKKGVANGDLIATEKASADFLAEMANLNKIHKAADEGLRSAARTLASAKQSMRDDFSVGHMYKVFQEASGEKPLPIEIVSRISEHAAKIAEMNERIKDLEDQILEQNKHIDKLQKEKPVTVEKEKIAKIDKKIKGLYDDWARARENRKNGPVQQGVGITDEDIGYIAKIALAYVEKGYLTSVDVAKQLKADVKKFTGMNLSEEDLMRVLDSTVEGKRVIDQFQNTGIPHGKETAEFGKLLSEPIPKDWKKKDSKAEKIRKMAAELDTRHKTTDFTTAGENYIADREARLLRAKIDRVQLKQRIKNEAEAIEYANRSKSEKAKEGVANVLNVPRSVMASFDFSAPMRQGLVATAAHPFLAMKAGKEMFKQAFSQKNFDDWLIKYKLSPEWELAKKSELYVADPHEFKNGLNGKEEAFMSNLAERIPVVGHGIKGSERAYVGYLNKLRTDVFKQGVEQLQANGKTFESHPEEYKALADFVNNSTGRGKLPNKTIEDAAPLLNSIFFSPRLIASRINLMNPVKYYKMPPSVKMMAIKDVAKFVGFASAVLLMAKCAGADVGTDPHSSDFAKMKVGNTRFDMLGGFQQYIHFAAEEFPAMLGGGYKKTGRHIQDLNNPGYKGTTRADVAISFLRSKTSPAVGMAWDFLATKDAIGQPVTVPDELASHFEPLLYQDIKDAYQDGGWNRALLVASLSTFGIGTGTYDNSSHKKQRPLKDHFKAYLRDRE